MVFYFMASCSDFEGASSGNEAEEDDKLTNIDPTIVKLIQSHIMVETTKFTWDDVAGLEYAKSTIQVTHW
jgi:hypothetical protein